MINISLNPFIFNLLYLGEIKYYKISKTKTEPKLATGKVDYISSPTVGVKLFRKKCSD